MPNVCMYVEKHQTPLSDDRPGSVPALDLISRAASSVGAMYRSHGPNTGSNPGGGQIQKKGRKLIILQSPCNWSQSVLFLFSEIEKRKKYCPDFGFPKEVKGFSFGQIKSG